MSIRRYSDKSAKFMMIMAAGWAFILTFIIMADIISRGLFNDPLNGVREIVANSIVIIVFLQAGYAIRSRSMLSADFLVSRFPPLAQRIALGFGYLLGAAFFAFIIWGGWQLAIDSWVGGEFEGEGALRVPSWPTRFVILIGSALAIINYLVVAYLDVVQTTDSDTEAVDAYFRARPTE
ncbi:MAG: TRAP transporter small permease [Betaproteobacteria bacterium]|nr:TRAP transporter small permease [Betaproteobacteria bacterium]